MGVDKSYGSGKPRSAANSRARARVAAKRFTKGKKNPEFNLVSKAGEIADFAFNGPKETRGKYAELGVSSMKLAAVAKALFSAGKTEKAIQVGMRNFVKTGGKAVGRSMAGDESAVFKVLGKRVPVDGNRPLLQSIRSQTTKSVFPRAVKAVKSGTQAFNERKSILASKRQSQNWLKGK
jgi:hypothetical protein